MENSKKQQKRIEKDLYSRFTHPSPSLKKKWEKRRQKEGDGQKVLTQEIEEWINEGKELKELKAIYKKRLTERLWNNQTFRQDVNKAHNSYNKSNSLALAKELQGIYSLNYGWLFWLAHCIVTEENDPSRLILYHVREKGRDVKHISLDIYFPLPESLYVEASIYLRMKEPEILGDYYNQEQGGGRLEHSRPQETIAKYRKIINLRTSASWRMKTDKDFLDHYTQYNRSELTRAKKWEREGKPR